MPALSKFTADAREAILTAIRCGCTHDKAAELAGLRRVTVWRWLQRGEQDERNGVDSEFARFCADFRQATSFADATLEKSLYQVAMSGSDWRCTAWTLARRMPERYGSKVVRKAVVEQLTDDRHQVGLRIRTSCLH